MALNAGRKGVNPAEVDALGYIKSGITPEERAKLGKALVSPLTAPTEKELVGVDTGNAQIMAKVGNGLKMGGTTSPYELGLDAPEYGIADAGKVLTVGDDGALIWGDPQRFR